MSVAALALAVYALFVEPRRLVVRREVLVLPGWAAGDDGLRVALLSDLHVGSPGWGLDRIAELVERTNAEHPDLVLLAGDYLINGVMGGEHVAPEPMARALAPLDAPLGVIAVLGNHDWWNDGVRVADALRSAGLTVLEDAHVRVPTAGGGFVVVGLADQMTRPAHTAAALAAVEAGQPLIVLVHEPDVFPTLPARVTLTLAGHTHGGQVRLPWLGRPVVPSAYGERYAAGHVVEEGRHLFVTTGVGTSILPARLGVPPELALLTLRAAPRP